MILLKKKPTIIRVKMLVGVAAVDWAYDAEQILDLPAPLAEQFIATGKAELAAPGAELAAGVDTLCPVGHNPRAEDTSAICIHCARM